MFCEQCGKVVDENDLYCGNCGAPVHKLEEEESDFDSYSDHSDNPEYPDYPKKETRRGGNMRILVIVLLAVLFIALAAVAGFFAVQYFAGSGGSSAPAPSATAPPSAEAQSSESGQSQNGFESGSQSQNGSEAWSSSQPVAGSVEPFSESAAGSVEPFSESAAASIEPFSESETGSVSMIQPGTAETQAQSGSDYILPNSGSAFVTSSQLKALTTEELRIARNEIYARHGRKFNDQVLQSYFDQKSWYHGTIEPDDFTDDMLNKYEKENRDRIVKEEQSR